jgi:hypothetical protein
VEWELKATAKSVSKPLERGLLVHASLLVDGSFPLISLSPFFFSLLFSFDAPRASSARGRRIMTRSVWTKLVSPHRTAHEFLSLLAKLHCHVSLARRSILGPAGQDFRNHWQWCVGRAGRRGDSFGSQGCKSFSVPTPAYGTPSSPRRVAPHAPADLVANVDPTSPAPARTIIPPSPFLLRPARHRQPLSLCNSISAEDRDAS